MKTEQEISAKLKEYLEDVKHWEKAGISANANRYAGFCELLKWVLGKDALVPH